MSGLNGGMEDSIQYGSDAIEKAFPDLVTIGYKISSPQNYRYNCIAWAVKTTQNGGGLTLKILGFGPQGFRGKSLWNPLYRRLRVWVSPYVTIRILKRVLKRSQFLLIFKISQLMQQGSFHQENGQANWDGLRI